MSLKVVSFSPKENPSVESLISVDPEIVALLPENYLGEVNDANLAAVFVNALQKYGSVKALNTFDVSAIPEGMSKGNTKKYAKTYLRFFHDGTDFGLYYDFQNIFNKSVLSDEEIFYAMNVVDVYGTRTRSGILNTLKNIFDYRISMGEDNPRAPIPVESLKNMFKLADVLRHEGTQMVINQLWVCSTHWTADEVFELISEGMNIKQAVELYGMGFETIEDILVYGRNIPKSWMDRIINGPPTKQAL